ncbi:uncharacterized protein Chchd3 [Chelonus insularis]|uniref:uncharacterized protein Chchd3 n=1 Tax=Chelonus insularis TaxID=460826 RepID=UPI00158C937E|nr:uncharacterized protein LOC118069663 [Chelonus insularis]
MGSGQSARKLTINNEEGVIQISKDLVQRLTQNSQQAASSRTDPSPTGETQEKVSTKPIEPHQKPLPQPAISPQVSSAGLGHPGYSVPEYTITAYKLLQQQEKELQNQEQYWQQRLAKLQMDNERINKIFQDEYNRAVNDIMTAPGQKNINIDTAVPPCITEREKIIKCYQTNPKEILKCANVVQEFSNCVDQHRTQIISTQC